MWFFELLFSRPVFTTFFGLIAMLSFVAFLVDNKQSKKYRPYINGLTLYIAITLSISTTSAINAVSDIAYQDISDIHPKINQLDTACKKYSKKATILNDKINQALCIVIVKNNLKHDDRGYYVR